MIDEQSATQSNTADLMRPVATEAPAVIDDRYVLKDITIVILTSL
jgi:hypothetical protein